MGLFEANGGLPGTWSLKLGVFHFLDLVNPWAPDEESRCPSESVSLAIHFRLKIWRIHP